MAQANDPRAKKKKRIRGRISGTSERPRLTVFRSAKQIYAQVVDDFTGVTLASASSLKVKERSEGKLGVAKAVGLQIANACKDKNIEKVVFDRNGFLFHGRIKALADSAREAGLNF